MNLSKLCSVEPQLSSVVLQSPRPEDTEFILAGSLALEPSLEHSKKVRDWVGLRPGRDSVRLGRERRDGLEIVHNYGHGGSGITVFQVSLSLLVEGLFIMSVKTNLVIINFKN